MNLGEATSRENLLHLQTYFQEIFAYLAHYLDPEANPKVDQVQTPPKMLTQLAAAFQLSPFEQRILIACAAQELSPDFCRLLESFEPASVTFNMAMAILPDPHWSACTVNSPLRKYQLLQMSPGPSLMTRTLKIDERILVALLGMPDQDSLFTGCFTAITPPAQGSYDEKDALAIANQWLARPANPHAFLLTGADAGDRERLAAASAQLAGRSLFAASLDNLPGEHTAFDTLCQHLDREHRLTPIAILLHDFDGEPAQHSLAKRILSKPEWFLILSQDHRLAWHGTRPTVHYELPALNHAQRRDLWLGAGEDFIGEDRASHLASHFGLGRTAIEAVCARAKATNPEDPSATLWEFARQQARPNLENMAVCVAPKATMDQLVLPAEKKRVLEQIEAQVRHRVLVYDQWGFGNQSGRGLGVNALFHGISGTGKTLAAEALANSLRLDLYHVDLSAIISKYIGETEKNLAKVFDAAERSGAVLFFDEADALFGKRSSVRDSHDRFANIQVSYLLQRLESYRGLAILATNDKAALDPAFTRRIKFIVEYPFPSKAERTQIWQRVIPAQAPTANLDYEKLAQLNVTGGHIRAIVVQAAFAAANEGNPIRMQHMLGAARNAYTKMGKRITPSEIGNWEDCDRQAPESRESHS